MYTDSYPHRNTGKMPELEGAHECQDVQRHAANIHCMPVPVSLWKTRSNHVGIPYCLHLRIVKETMMFVLIAGFLNVFGFIPANTLYTSWWSTMLSNPL